MVGKNRDLKKIKKSDFSDLNQIFVSCEDFALKTAPQTLSQVITIIISSNNNNIIIIIIIYTEFKHHTFWMVAAREAMPGRQTSQRDKVE